MKIGLIEVDGNGKFPNIPLMKISAFHKAHSDNVEWVNPLFGGHYDKVYKSKIFSFSPDYVYPIDADIVVSGGTGYAITKVGDKEYFNPELNVNLPNEIEHIYPDYSLYDSEIFKDTAYGFLTRGCPRGCEFCHVAPKEGRKSYKVADLSEWWNGQKQIQLCDPNILACPDSIELLQQLKESRARVNFNQGLDVRLINDRNIDVLRDIKKTIVHFAWDKIEDEEIVYPKLKMAVEAFKLTKSNCVVYCLCNYNTTLEQDLHRIYKIRDLGIKPYVMLYDKKSLERGNIYNRLARWVNNPFIWASCERFEDFSEAKRGKSRMQLKEAA